MLIFKQEGLLKKRSATKTSIAMLALVQCCLVCLHCFAQEVTQPGMDSNFHIYLLMGQSNMSGRGEITTTFSSIPNNKILTLNKECKWVIAKHPLHFDKSVAGVGPGLKFAQEMLKVTDDKVSIGLVPCAVGGTSINKWQKGAYDARTETHPYDDAIVRIKQAMQKGIIKGVIWHQGESDSKDINGYLKKLKQLILTIREVVQNPNLPFVVGELGRYNDSYQAINLEIQKVESLLPLTAVVSSRNLKDIGDHTHFNSGSATKLGKRYAKAMKSLLKEAPE